MAKSSCLNTEGSSSPVPVIGLYIAGVSLVCLILMLSDMLFGLRRKTRYIPCRFFSLNSVTLTLLGIASKLPVDLTTHMPSARDQLSKLTGTTMVCICMGFLMPSIANNGRSESITNIAALSILVVTIVVNICTQMATGVIFSFKVEHITVMCFMLMLMFVLWFSTLDVNRIKSILANKNKDLFAKGEKSFMYRVKRWYIYSCLYNPQLVACRDFCGLTTEVICIICSLVLFQAAIRSLVFSNMEFCEGISDYKWSMWMIIITQIGAIIVGSLTIAFRWFALVRHYNYTVGNFMEFEYINFDIQFSFMKNRSIKTSIMVLSRLALKFGLTVIFAFIVLTVGIIPLLIFGTLIWILKQLLRHPCKTKDDVSIDSWIEEFEDVGFDNKEELLEWMMKICVKDMNRWMNAKIDSLSYMVQMLSRPRPSSESTLLNKYQNVGQSYSNEYKVTCLSMVILVKVVAISIPSNLTESLRHTLDEAFKIIYYVDEKINVGNKEDSRRRELAKLLWTGGDIYLNKKALIHSNGSVEYAISNLESACETFRDEFATRELNIIRDFMTDRAYASIDEFCNYIEELFAEMLHSFLTQLPNSIFKEIHEGPIESCEERARVIIKFLSELKPSLEDKVQWKFPAGTSITRLFDSEDHNANV